MNHRFSRRRFLQTSTLVAGSGLILPRARLDFGVEANTRLRVAALGAASMSIARNRPLAPCPRPASGANRGAAGARW